jgi:putative peptidoglycan lipid II flippase
MAVASFFGAGLASDAFFVAFKIPNLLRRLVAEGCLATAFVPIFTDELSASKEEAKKAAASVLSFTIALTLLLSALGIWFSPEITDIFAPGFATIQNKRELASSLMRVMFPYIVFVSVLALVSGMLNSLGHFALPAAAPALLNIVLIAGLFLLTPFFREPIYGLAWAVLLGGVASVIPQFVLLRKLGFPLRLSSPFHSPAVRKLILLMLPAILSSSVYQLMVFFNTLLASLLQEGSVSWLYYADRLFQFPMGVFSLAVATALLPTLSHAASQGDEKRFSRQLTLALHWVTVITIPASVGLIMLAEPLIELVYEHGSFSRESTLNTASALQAYTLGLWSISAQSVLVRAYLAKKNSLTPSIVSIAAISLNVLLAFSLMGPAATSPETNFARLITKAQGEMQLFALSHVGLALAGSVASLLALLLLLLPARRYGITIEVRPLLASFSKIVLCSGVMGALLYLLLWLKLNSLLTLLLGVPGSILCFFALCCLLRVEGVREIPAELLKHLRKTVD